MNVFKCVVVALVLYFGLCSAASVYNSQVLFFRFVKNNKKKVFLVIRIVRESR